MERIGTDPITGVKIESTTDEKSRAQGHTADEFERPSDHFGLYVQFDRYDRSRDQNKYYKQAS